MGDPIIEAKANRFADALREAFRKLSPPNPEIDDPIIEIARKRVMRCLRAEKAARTRKRKKHERNGDLFTGDSSNGS